MHRFTSRLCYALLFSGIAISVPANPNAPNLQAFRNSNGIQRSFSSQGSIDLGNAFFQSIGSNGRSCATCHQPGDGWSMTPAHLQQRFATDGGLDPVFRPVDGANCPSADVSTVDARRTAYSLLMSRGLIRVELPVPPTAEFTVVAVDDPYACPQTNTNNLALYRRPLPSTNLRFLTGVMWDGRETFAGNALADNLAHQAMDATTGHAQGNVPTAAQVQEIVNFETALTTAQSDSDDAGPLDGQNGNGGPMALTQQQFFVGIDDPLAGNPVGSQFDPSAMTLYSNWESLTSSPNAKYTDARLSVARGEKIFDTHPINITGVAGINDALQVDTFAGTCTTCHNTPNVGNHSVPLQINIGLNDASRRTPDMPLYTLRNKLTGETVQTMDPGRAMITGHWADIGKTKGPVLRGLSARAPYFHNGSAANFDEVIDFYENRFHLGLSPQERSDLIAFLKTL